MTFIKNKKKIKALCVVSSLNIGGVETMLCNSINNNFLYEQDLAILKDQFDSFLVNNLKGKTFFYNLKKGHSFIIVSIKLIKLLYANKYNVIHAHDPLALFFCSLLKFFKPNVVVIYTLHSTGFFQRVKRTTKLLLKYCTNKVVCISGPVFNECKNEKIFQGILIHNGVCIDAFNAPTFKKNKRFTIVNIGRLSLSQKGQDILIKASAICRDQGYLFDLFLIGGESADDRKSKPAFESLIKKHNLYGMVHLEGLQHNVVKYLQMADLFVLPSLYEGFGNVLIEAMAAEVPVLASNVDGPKELICDGNNGILFQVGNEKGLADKIIWLMNKPEKRNIIAKQGKHFSKKFDIKIMIKKHYELYSDLLKRN